MAKNSERLYLLDGMALAYRAYYAFITRPLINSKGENTSAIFGFINSLMKILAEEKPDHIAVVFDAKGPTFRHSMYTAYKATRQKMPEDMAGQMEKLKEVVRAFNIPLIELPGYEADDVIGTLAKKAEKEGVATFMVTGDKDFMQLVSPLIKIYRPGKGGTEIEIIDEAGVETKFGVKPGLVTDVLGLIGDKSDNVPGVPGIGEKTAIPLIQKYGPMEELLARADEIPQKGVREKLRTNKEQALLSKKLVTIHTDVPLTIDFHQLRAAKRDTIQLIRLFGELEFKALADKLRSTEDFSVDAAATAEQAVEREAKSIHTEEHAYCDVTTEKDLDFLVVHLKSAKQISLNIIMTGDNALRGRMLGIALSFKEGEAWYIPFSADAREKSDLFGVKSQIPKGRDIVRLNSSAVFQKLKPVLEDERIEKISANLKHEMLALGVQGIEVRGTSFDTMVASYVLRADGQHGLDASAKDYLNYSVQTREELLGKGKSQKQLAEIPPHALTDYAGEKVDIALQVSKLQKERLMELEMLELSRDIEFPLIGVLARMEARGVALNTEYLNGMSKELDRQIGNLVRDICADAGGEFNINSTQQLSDVLFNRLNLPTVRKTKTGFSTDVGVLELLQGRHPIIDKLLEYRQYTKLKSTYIDALPQLINPQTGRVHTSFNQTVAATGRLSSSDPNLQNIPIRTELGSAIRKAFVPGNKDMVIMSADYSQIELRVMAHISGDEGLLSAFRNNEDIHATTSAKVFGVPASEVTRDMRRKAKEVNFGIMYGIGPFGLAKRLEISQAEAKDIIARYFERFPNVRQYINDTIDSARRRGYVSTLMGRRRYMPDINSRNFNIRSNAERQAINMPIQGTAADMIKVAMIGLDKAIRERHLRSKMLMQVHDELVFEVVKAEVETMTKLVIDLMQNALNLKVPVVAEVGTGGDWLEAH